MGLLASIGLRGGIIAAALLAAFLWHQIDRSKAYEAGKLAERLVWMEQRAKDIARLEAERKTTQAKIDQVERDYWAARTNRDIAISDLEKALADEKLSTPDPVGNCTCRSGMSQRLRDQLDAIGR